MSNLPKMQTRHLARALWAWLLVAMVAVQILGFMHHIMHAAPPLGEGQVYQLRVNVHEPAIAKSWVAQLFAEHDDESGCRLYDQCSHGAFIPAVPAVCLPSQALLEFLQVFAASILLMNLALVQARGPPSIR
jgi:hypothetical protein